MGRPTGAARTSIARYTPAKPLTRITGIPKLDDYPGNRLEDGRLSRVRMRAPACARELAFPDGQCTHCSGVTQAASWSHLVTRGFVRNTAAQVSLVAYVFFVSFRQGPRVQRAPTEFR